jgi:hypothetical protein
VVRRRRVFGMMSPGWSAVGLAGRFALMLARRNF